MGRLAELAGEKFPNLSEAELKVACSAEDGRPAEVDGGTIRADLVQFVLGRTGRLARVQVAAVGVRGAKIEGELKLTGLRVPSLLALENCTILGGIDASHAQLQSVSVTDCTVGRTSFEGTRIIGNLDLSRSQFEVREAGGSDRQTTNQGCLTSTMPTLTATFRWKRQG